jgi:hypothetical protein
MSKLRQKMNQTSKLDKSTGPGWERIVNALLIYCELNALQPLQIKEKFGNLRFYYQASKQEGFGQDKTFDNLLKAAEIKASKTCEWCGAPGRLRNYDDGFNWLKTLCDTHATEWREGKRWWLTEDGKHV